ncbi:MAG: serine/threonine-protein kinase [Polyangiaceae bacterium]
MTSAGEVASKDPVGPGSIVLGKYRVEAVIGRGGMALVATARHLELGHRVALKVLLVEEGEDRALAHHRMMHEALAAACLRSPHTAKVLDVGTTDGGDPVMVVEHLKGRDVAAELSDMGRLPVDDAILVATQACEALAEAHALGIVHRDVKLANLFLVDTIDGSRHVKLLDFGIARTMPFVGGPPPGDLGFGSPAYMAPERIEDPETTDPRVDIWALGVCLYEMLTGRMPFTGDSFEALFVRILVHDPEPVSSVRPEVPLGLSAIVQWCLDKDPERRPADVAELAKLLEGFGPAATRGTGRRTERVLSTRAKVQSQRPLLNLPLPKGASNARGIPRAPSSLSALTHAGDVLPSALPGDARPSLRRYGALAMAVLVGLVGGLGVKRIQDSDGAAATEPPASEAESLPRATANADVDAGSDAGAAR